MKIGNKIKKIKDHFIPHKGNDYKPHFLRHESMLAIFLFIIVIELAFLAQVFIVFDKTKFLAAVLPGVLTNLTNNIRTENNIGQLAENELLRKAAQMKADDMAKRGYFSHNTPEGKTPWYFLEQVGYKYSYAGENLAVNFFESSDVSLAWMNSQSHRANIIKKDYTEIGIAVANGVYEGKNTVFVVQFFGTPAKLSESVNDNKTNQIQKEVSSNIVPPVVKNTTKSAPKKVEVKPTLPTPAPILTQVLGEESTKKVEFISADLNKIKLFFEKILTSPNTSTNFIFTIILVFISICLLLALFIRSEVYHPQVMYRGAAMIAIIAFLLYVNLNIVHFDTYVPENSLSANVIAY